MVIEQVRRDERQMTNDCGDVFDPIEDARVIKGIMERIRTAQAHDEPDYD